MTDRQKIRSWFELRGQRQDKGECELWFANWSGQNKGSLRRRRLSSRHMNWRIVHKLRANWGWAYFVLADCECDDDCGWGDGVGTGDGDESSAARMIFVAYGAGGDSGGKEWWNLRIVDGGWWILSTDGGFVWWCEWWWWCWWWWWIGCWEWWSGVLDPEPHTPLPAEPQLSAIDWGDSAEPWRSVIVVLLLLLSDPPLLFTLYKAKRYFLLWMCRA